MFNLYLRLREERFLLRVLRLLRLDRRLRLPIPNAFIVTLVLLDAPLPEHFVLPSKCQPSRLHAEGLELHEKDPVEQGILYLYLRKNAQEIKHFLNDV